MESDFDLIQEESNIVFYTSDNLGEYKICLEGFTKDGKPISIREKFNVEDYIIISFVLFLSILFVTVITNFLI